MKKQEIRIRDPFILFESGKYYLFGTTDKTCWEGKGESFLCYTSSDLEDFSEPVPAFIPDGDFWADRNFWAPEVHKFGDRFYMFASFKSSKRHRGTQILISEKPEGPYIPLTDSPYTPSNWECLDGTFFVEDGTPYSVFCHEWTQIQDGTICLVRLSSDLKTAVTEPVELFKASDAAWTISHDKSSNGTPCYVTDGPFIHKMTDGTLIMIWSSFSSTGYTVGQARSTTGINGRWELIDEPLFYTDGGHSMIFKTLTDSLFMSLHQPNITPLERPVFVEIEEDWNNRCLRIKN